MTNRDVYHAVPFNIQIGKMKTFLIDSKPEECT